MEDNRLQPHLSCFVLRWLASHSSQHGETQQGLVSWDGHCQGQVFGTVEEWMGPVAAHKYIEELPILIQPQQSQTLVLGNGHPMRPDLAAFLHVEKSGLQATEE